MTSSNAPTTSAGPVNTITTESLTVQYCADFPDVDSEIVGSVVELMQSGRYTTQQARTMLRDMQLQAEAALATAPNASNMSSNNTAAGSGGNDDVLLFIATVTGDRQTHDHCRSFATLLTCLGVRYTEVDVSSNAYLRRRVLGLVPTTTDDDNRTSTGGGFPYLFVGDRYVADYAEAVDLNDNGKLLSLIRG
eukprot:PhM_4_TR5717/c0_g1_i1/m.54374